MPFFMKLSESEAAALTEYSNNASSIASALVNFRVSRIKPKSAISSLSYSLVNIFRGYLAFNLQLSWRSESPGLYSLIPQKSVPEPARRAGIGPGACKVNRGFNAVGRVFIGAGRTRSSPIAGISHSRSNKPNGSLARA